MKGFLKPKLIFTFVTVVMLAAAFTVSLLSGSIIRSHAASPRGKLIIFVQGVTSTLTSAQIKDTKNGDFHAFNTIFETILGTPGFHSPTVLFYSYTGSTDTGAPKTYECQDTFTSPIPGKKATAAYVTLLSTQINNALSSHPNSDVYLIGHSEGGVIAFGYLAYLKSLGFPALPHGGILKGIVTLDSPIGGVPPSPSYLVAAALAFDHACPALTPPHKKALTLQSLLELVSIFKTTSKPTFPPPDDTLGESQGEHASILEAIFGGAAETNQGVAEDAFAHGTSVLTVGNKNDLLFAPNKCSINGDFINTQWVEDEKADDNLNVYGRDFSSGFPGCALGLFNKGNHLAVLDDATVQSGLMHFLPAGGIPTPLAIAPPGD
ncbi:MAG: hypothetical protein ACJ788_00635 [Ktedonobacteraceae bacterium]